jgi:hypothetical protein
VTVQVPTTHVTWRSGCLGSSTFQLVFCHLTLCWLTWYCCKVLGSAVLCCAVLCCEAQTFSSPGSQNHTGVPTMKSSPSTPVVTKSPDLPWLFVAYLRVRQCSQGNSHAGDSFEDLVRALVTHVSTVVSYECGTQSSSSSGGSIGKDDGTRVWRAWLSLCWLSMQTYSDFAFTKRAARHVIWGPCDQCVTQCVTQS